MYKHAPITVLLILSLAGFSFGQSAEKGIIDLQEHNFQSNGPAELSGHWEFYYGKLFTPIDFDSNTIQPSQYITIFESWHNNGNFPVIGYATYRCVVILPKNQKGLLMYIPAINTASKIWINGIERAATGIVSSDPNIFKAQLRTVYVPIPEYTDTVEVVVQVANFAYFRAGMISSPKIGLAAELIEKKSRANGIENFFAGSLIAMFIYQFILYFFYSRGKPNLWLALICLGVAFRSMILSGGSYLLPGLFPDVPFEIWKKIEFGSVYLITAIFPLYIHHLFKSSSSQILIGIFVSVASLMVVAVLVTPQHIYGQLLEICHLMYVLSFVYAIYTIAKAWKSGNHDAHIIFFGVLASSPFILLTVMKNSSLVNINIRFEYLVELGVLVFLLFQVYILARHYANSYKSLEEINRELEAEVTQRTSELVESNSIKDRLLSVISHDVKSPLNALQSLISLYRGNNLSKEEFDQFIDKLAGDLGTTTGLVENILYWTASQRRGEEVTNEKVNLKLLIEQNISHSQAVARNKSITIAHNVPDDLELTTDRGILHFTLRNLIANAIKFSHSGGKIDVTVEMMKNHLILMVTDHGIGMSEEQLNQLFISELAQSTIGTKSEKGTGLGLSLCREYLKKIGAELLVVSQEGKGSTFKIVFPKH